MAGQDATTPLKQAKAQQERICANEHQGSKGSSSSGTQGVSEKAKHQG